MKGIVPALFMAVFAVSAYAQNMTAAANLNRYREQNASVSPGAVVFLGNSITDAWPRISPEFFSSNNYIGRGISGQTGSNLLLRFRQDVVDLKPAAVVINIGTNDIALNSGPYDPKFTLDCIKSMAEIAQNNGIAVFLSSVLPVKEYPWRKEVRDVPSQIDSLNAAIKAYAASKGFPYVNYNTPMREADGSMKAGYSTDGVHPTKDGYEVMEKVIKEVFRKHPVKKARR